MKHFFWVPPVFFLGILAGAWGPRESLRAERNLDNKQNEVIVNREAERLGSFGQIVNIPENASRRPRDKPPAPQNNIGVTNKPPSTVEKSNKPQDLSTRIEWAQDAWRVRVDVARATLLNNLEIKQEDAGAIDDTLNGMNEKLYDLAEELAGMLANDEPVTPETAARLTAAFSETLVQTYDALAEVLPADKKSEASNVRLFDFIDPGVASPLISVQDKLDKAASVFAPTRRRR